MKYSIDEFIAAAEQELEAWKCEGEKKRTDFDYEKLGFVRAVAKRLQDHQPVLPQADVSSSADIDDHPLTQCMVGRDTECNHPKCPVTDEDAANGRYCTLPLYDYRQ